MSIGSLGTNLSTTPQSGELGPVAYRGLGALNGGPVVAGLDGFFLHAESLRLVHPTTGDVLEVHAPLPDDREALFRQIQKETGDPAETDSEYRIVRPDGTIRWIHSRAIPFRDESGQVSRIIGFAEDITSRKLAEQALREAQQRHRALLDSIPDAAWLMDAAGRDVTALYKYYHAWGGCAALLMLYAVGYLAEGGGAVVDPPPS